MGRPLAVNSPMQTTYLLRLDKEPSEVLSRFIARVGMHGASMGAVSDEVVDLDSR